MKRYFPMCFSKLVNSGSAPNLAIVKNVRIIKPLNKRKIIPVIEMCTVGLNKYIPSFFRPNIPFFNSNIKSFFPFPLPFISQKSNPQLLQKFDLSTSLPHCGQCISLGWELNFFF
jgi:hypothetical protein